MAKNLKNKHESRSAEETHSNLNKRKSLTISTRKKSPSLKSYKVVLLGTMSMHIFVFVFGLKLHFIDTGKTSLIQKFLTNSFSSPREETVSVDCSQFNFPHCTLNIWDTGLLVCNSFCLLFFFSAGQERFNALIRQYLRGHCCILVFDITDRSTFEKIDSYKTLFESENQSNSLLFILVGTKIDLESNRKVTREEAYNLLFTLCGEKNKYR